MSATSDLPRVELAPEVPRSRRIARLLWPVPILLIAISGIAGLRFDLDFGSLGIGPFVLAWVVPYALAVAFVGYAIGGRRGILVSAALAALVVWWVYAFGWDISATEDATTTTRIATALGEAGRYHLEILITLWPFAIAVLVIALAVALVRRRGLWSTLGLLTLAGTVLLVPTGAGWDDGCNGRYGASPVLTKPTAGALMDAGVQVIPSGASTLMDCGYGDREFKPFWQGDDGLPPAPQLQTRSIPVELGFPAALPSGDDAWLDDATLKVGALRLPGVGQVGALIRTARPLVAGEGWVVRIDGVPANAITPFTPKDRSGSCADVLWSAQQLRGNDGASRSVDWTVYGRPEERPTVRVTVERGGRVLASARLRLQVQDGRRGTAEALLRRTGCERADGPSAPAAASPGRP